MPSDDSALRALATPEALLFDLDGTLVDTVPARIETWLEAIHEAGIPAGREEVAALIGSDGRRLAREVAAASGRSLEPAATEALDRRAGELFEAANSAPRPLPGATALLGALAKSPIRSAIATSSRAAQVTRSIDALGLAARPPIIDGSHVRHAKPAPDLLLLAARRLGVAPASSWYVGDSTWDMLAAAAAGMVPIGVTSGAVTGDALARAGAAAVVADLGVLQAELTRRGALG